MPRLGQLQIENEVIEDEPATRCQLAVNALQPSSLILHRHQVADGVKGYRNQICRLRQAKVTEIGMDERYMVEDAGCLCSGTAAMQHLGRGVNAHD